jgi:hypothetical protein
VILDGARGLVAAVEGAVGGKDVATGSGRRLAASEAAVVFAAWLSPRGLLAGYDVFVSYRWGGLDMELADVLFAGLSCNLVRDRLVAVFLDRRRLQGGRNFCVDFATALVSSKVTGYAGQVPGSPPVFLRWTANGRRVGRTGGLAPDTSLDSPGLQAPAAVCCRDELLPPACGRDLPGCCCRRDTAAAPWLMPGPGRRRIEREPRSATEGVLV